MITHLRCSSRGFLVLSDVLLQERDIRTSRSAGALKLQDVLGQLLDRCLCVGDRGVLRIGGLLTPASILVVESL